MHDIPFGSLWGLVSLLYLPFRFGVQLSWGKTGDILGILTLDGDSSLLNVKIYDRVTP